MSEAAIEAMDSDAWDAAGEAGYDSEAGEAGFEGEAEGEAYADYGEDARSDARRRAQQQLAWRRQAQLRDARLRQMQVRRSRPVRRRGVTIPSQAVRTEVRPLDLQNSAAIDALRKRLDDASRLAYRNAWAGEASAAASQVLDSFETGLEPHDWARALIRGAPTLLLAPGKPRRPGIEGILLDPRVAGGALLAGVWAIGHFRNQSKDVHTIDVAVSGQPSVGAAAPGNVVQLTAVARDKAGNVVPNVTFTYTPNTSGLFTISETSPGVADLTAVRAGTTWLNVAAGGKQGGEFITVVP